MSHHPFARSLVYPLVASTLLGACGSAAPVPQPPSQPAARPEFAAIWSADGNVGTIHSAAIGEHSVFVVVSKRLESGGWEQRLHAIDRTTRRAISRVVGADVEILRADPLIVDTWDGERQRWLGTRIMRLSEELDLVWRSDLMNMSTPNYATGPLVLVTQGQRGEYVGLDPEDGEITFRLRGNPDEMTDYAVEAATFVAVPTDERAVLVDRASGEISGVVDARLGEWEVIGDRLVAATEHRVTGYDGHGRELWSREGEFPLSPARTILSWSPEEAPARSDVLLLWQRGHGLVALDEAGEPRWVYPLLDEEEWRDVSQRGERVFFSERATMLDVRTGRVLFEGGDGARITQHDVHSVLVDRPGPGGSTLSLRDYDGTERWQYAVASVDERGQPAPPSTALLDDVVATCGPEGPVVFLDRTDGSVLSTHAMPAAPDDRESSSPYCFLQARGDLVLAVTPHGASLFGRTRGDETPPEAPVSLEPLAPPPPDEAPATRALYRLAVWIPPREAHSPAYVSGRAAYARARDAFEAGRFQEAASGFIEAYRAFMAADVGDIQQLGLECCYNARLSIDRVGPAAYDAMLAGLTEAEATCRTIAMRAPPPSRPF